MPELTVVVCTHDRPESLRGCLAALAALEDQVEVIVVDSASQPPCRELVEDHGFSYLYEAEPGLSRARNAGLAASWTELVAFVDDDADVATDWARRIAAPFADPAVGCVGGACVARFLGPRPRWLSERLLQYAGITRFDEARESRSSSEYPFGANVAFRRKALAGFSERLGRTGSSLLSGEEAAAIDRLREEGWRVRLEPAAVVRHAVSPERLRSGYYWRRLWWQGRSRARGERSLRLTVRIVVALPVRLALFAATRDRVHLYRAAETPGYLRELAAR
jgi:cellulose synthase/poly-beta-1,6-N-acetylglucosamine synthase-like glycosyltransferase